ncbi:MAG: FKBP-type peptidyl-prolyl cis-trans isomerase [Nitrospirota bacterium]|jgi:FKBP-type peptidyl-prolyl cis-trans isomerase
MRAPFQKIVLLALCCLVPVGALAAEGFRTTPQGASYQDLKTGAGESAAPGDVVTMHFVGWLDADGKQGKEIYNSRREGRPVSFVVGTERVMAGWSDGVIGMKPGGKRLLRVPPRLAYGAKGVEGVIPPNAALVFLIDLIAVEKLAGP